MLRGKRKEYSCTERWGATNLKEGGRSSIGSNRVRGEKVYHRRRKKWGH